MTDARTNQNAGVRVSQGSDPIKSFAVVAHRCRQLNNVMSKQQFKMPSKLLKLYFEGLTRCNAVRIA